MHSQDLTTDLQSLVAAAAGAHHPLRLHGGDTKVFFGRPVRGEALDLRGHRGILRYEPTELVITARAGTHLAELEAALAERGQMLPCEPPHFAPGATIGGAVASGLAGPRRPWGGAPRDLLLGIRLLDGKAQVLRFGGEVMKNVAGYDVSRLMAGAQGTLGVLLEVSLKVLPRPASEPTLVQEADVAGALEVMQALQRRPLPLSGACHLDGRLYLRLAATPHTAQGLARELGARVEELPALWTDLRDQRLAFFQDPRPLWRLPPAAQLHRPEPMLIDWGGAQRWLVSDAPAQELRAEAQRLGGHATLFRGAPPGAEVFQSLSPPAQALHRRIKAVLDPQGIFNPGRLYAGW
jgi:glycolate dehydrogenase FAD-binding subunit